MRPSLVALAALSALSSSPLGAPAGEVWVVGPTLGAGVDATSVDDALALASDGDLVLVQPGFSVEPFTVDGLSVTIQGDPNGAVMPDFQDPTPPVAVTVRNLAPGQSVTVRDMVIFQFGHTNPMVEVVDNQGPVLFDDCFMDFLGGATIAEVRDSVSVSFTAGHMQVQRLDPDGVDFTEAAGIDALRSNVFVDNMFVLGPSGTDAFPIGGPLFFPPSPGAPGVRLRGSTLTLQGSSVQGGSGGSVPLGCFVGGQGGDAIVIDQDLGVPSHARLVASTATGGFGGFVNGECGLPFGLPGEAFDLINGSVEAQQGGFAIHQLAPQAKVAPNSTLGMTLVGEVGDFVFLIADTQALPGLFLPGVDITLHVLPQVIVPLGSLAAQIETRSLATPSLPASLDFVAFAMQGLFLGTTDAHLSGLTGTVLVD